MIYKIYSVKNLGGFCKICKDPISLKYTYCRICFRIRQKTNSTQNKKLCESKMNRVREDARRRYLSSNLAKSCVVCGYNKAFDVCHLKDISSFSKEALISEINSLDNLMALCKNHHWEMDRGLLEKRDSIKIKRYLQKIKKLKK